MTRPCRKGSDYAQDLCENETFYCNGRLMSLPYSDFFDSLNTAHAEPCFHYPRATSKIIIKENPTAKAIVPRFECFPLALSGISSSTTT